ncbi:hypothetical protein ACO0LD_26600 [Undibacterium sp. Ji83W]|uniref:hypothetical protein n=1 Tax=Undibacterium sp. Ji83W TaxID=3413043 RepID=UPI003BF0E692
MDRHKRKLADRMKELIDTQADKRGKFAQLESLTGIQSENWKSFYYGRQRPNPDMIEALAHTWPEFAFWLVTGIDDFNKGHTSPPTPHPSKLRERDAARAVFQKKIEFQRWLESADVNENDYQDIKLNFYKEISDLSSIRLSQEDILESIEEKEKITRPDSGLI